MCPITVYCDLGNSKKQKDRKIKETMGLGINKSSFEGTDSWNTESKWDWPEMMIGGPMFMTGMGS